MVDERALDEHLGAVLNRTLDAVYQAKQVAWGASGSPLAADLHELVIFLAEESHLLMEAEERVDGRAEGIRAPSTHQRGNVLGDSSGDVHAAVAQLLEGLASVVSDARERASAVGEGDEVRILSDFADKLEERVIRLRSS
jgi:hypothetical protein